MPFYFPLLLWESEQCDGETTRVEAYRFKNTWGSRDKNTRDEQGTSTHDSHEAYRYLWGFGLFSPDPGETVTVICSLSSPGITGMGCVRMNVAHDHFYANVNSTPRTPLVLSSQT